MTPGELDACFGRFAATAFRLETLGSYSVPGEEARAEAARRGGPRPERSVRTSPWLARIALTTISEGKRWQRARVVDEPLTPYQRDQMASYVESQAAGEEIRVCPRADAPGSEDFWLFDDAVAVLLSYDDEGRFTGAAIAERAETIRDCRAARAVALRYSVPLNEYLASRRLAQSAA